VERRFEIQRPADAPAGPAPAAPAWLEAWRAALAAEPETEPDPTPRFTPPRRSWSTPRPRVRGGINHLS
jgi:hypothetical protein